LLSAPKASRTGHITLKDQNRIPLIGVLGLNLIVLILVVKTGRLLEPSGISDLGEQWWDFLPAGVGVVFAGVVNGLLSSDTKARLVFWRRSNPLPASFAFSRYVYCDPRIDVETLRKITGDWPTEPRGQNALWYRLYKTVESEPAVTDAHRHFLLTRDYTAISFLLLLTAGPLGIEFITSPVTASAYVGLLLLQYLLARQAARNYGVRLVTTVLALKAAGK
jgi:hypothetical protein